MKLGGQRMDAPQLRMEVRNLLLAFDRAFAPGDAYASDLKRHTFRLRFALARVDEQAHAAVMESPFYTPERFAIALAILRTDVDRARAFIESHGSAPVIQSVDVQREEELAQRAA